MTSSSDPAVFDSFAEDLQAERTARPLIIIGAAKLDSLLHQILKMHLLPKAATMKDPDELLDGDRPLSTFSSRIKICYRLGLIDETMFSGLEKVRTLRNSSAHSTSFDISKSPAREHFTDLHRNFGNRASYRLTKVRFFHSADLTKFEELQCTLLTLCVLLEAVRVKTTATRGNKTTLRIASR